MHRSVTTLARRSLTLLLRANRSLWEQERTSAKQWLSSSQSKAAVDVLSKTGKKKLLPTTILDHTNLFMNNQRRFLGMSFSELAGNLGFICVTAAYLSTDILLLRSLAMSSITLGIIFQFYRAAPLWIPIKWNFMLLAINGVMITTLLAERHRANRMPLKLEMLFQEAYFEKRGFSRVEFNKLFQIGKEVHYKAGEFLTRDGQENCKL
jgi:hypothetical protein